MSFNDNDTNNNANNNLNNNDIDSMNNTSFDNGFNNYENSDFGSPDMNQYDSSSIGNASYDQPDYSDFGNSDTGDYSNNDNGLKKKLIIVIVVIIAIILLILLFSSLFGKSNKKLDLDVPNVVYAGSEVEFVTAIPNSNKELFYKFTSDNEDILQFEYKSLAAGDTANTMILKKDGKVKIKVQAFDNGKNAGVYENEVIVCPKFDENIFSSGDYKVAAGDDLSLNVDLGVYEECYKNIKYTSTDEEVAAVSSDGIVSAKKKGSTTIKVNNGYKTVTKKVNVVAASGVNSVTGVKLNVTSLTINVNSSGSLSAIVSPSDATNKAVTWSSSNESVALVSSKGKVVGVGVGSAVITVTTQDGNKTAMANVTVKRASSSSSSSGGSSSSGSSSSSSSSSSYKKVTKVSINSDDFTLKVGNTKSLTYAIKPSNATNKKVTWDTSNPSIAKVSTAGKVTGVGAGTAYITIKSVDGVSDKVKVVVTKSDPIKATKITLSPSSLTLNVGAKKAVTATVTPSNASIKTVTWVSHNTSIAKVDSNGNVTGIGAGSTKISAYTTDGNVTASMNVTVKSNSSSGGSTTPTNPTKPTEPEEIDVNSLIVTPTSVEIYVGDSKTISATVLPSSATNKRLTWTSGNSGVASVSSSGVIKGLRYGTTTVKVASVSNPSVSKVITVSVKNKPKSMSCTTTFTDQNGTIINGTAGPSVTTIHIRTTCNASGTTIKDITLMGPAGLISVSSLGLTGSPSSTSRTKTGSILNANTKAGSYTIGIEAFDADGITYRFKAPITINGSSSSSSGGTSVSCADIKAKSEALSGKVKFHAYTTKKLDKVSLKVTNNTKSQSYTYTMSYVGTVTTEGNYKYHYSYTVDTTKGNKYTWKATATDSSCGKTISTSEYTRTGPA